MKKTQSWLDPGFRESVLEDTVRWGIETLPHLLLLGVLAFVVLRVSGGVLGRLQRHLIARHAEDGSGAAAEYEKRAHTLVGIAKRTILVVVWSMVALLALAEVGIDVGPLIAGAGIVGLALGFGAQELVRDVISGFFILMENHVRTGDVAVINGTGGLVESIGLRTIRLRDLSGIVHVFQNGKIDTLSNMTKQWSAMLFDIGVAYKEDTDRVAEIMRRVAEGLQQDDAFKPKILEPLEIFGVDEFGDSAVVIKARLKTVPMEQWSVGREYRRRLKYAFDEAGIEIPFPHRTLYWGEASPPLAIETQPIEDDRSNGRARDDAGALGRS